VQKATKSEKTAIDSFPRIDYTATTILSKFQNDTAGRSVERVLEKLSKKKAAEILAVGPPPQGLL
jgi:hypothetical protein